MSHAGRHLKTAIKIYSALEEGKPHTSITDWIEVLSSDRYDELSLDGIPELVESVNIQGVSGTTEASRAIRKKLKYGNVHRQLRALVILRAMTENAGKGFQLNWANQELLGRLRDMAGDSLLDPKVKKRLILVFNAWSIQYKDEPRMQTVAKLYSQFGAGPGVRKPTSVPAVTTTTRTTDYGSRSTTTSPTTTTALAAPRGGFTDIDEIFGHDWAPTKKGADTYADLAAAKADAEQRKREREARIAIEQREAEVERREREFKRKQDMAALESRRQAEATEEAERRRLAKDQLKNQKAQPKRPPFNLERERPTIMISIANALQSANTLVNACRHINREFESVTESPKVQEALDKAKATRRVLIRYLQQVLDEALVGTLIDANEKVVEAIQLYDKLSKPAVLDSDSDSDAAPKDDPKKMAALTRKMEAQKLEADRTGELARLQERQKRESAKKQQRRAEPTPKRGASGVHSDLQDLDFGSISNTNTRLPPPMRPDDDRDAYAGGSLSDFSASDYDSSEDEYRKARSRRQSTAAPPKSAGGKAAYKRFDDDGRHGSKGLLDPNDPFADEEETPIFEKPRMQWAEI